MGKRRNTLDNASVASNACNFVCSFIIAIIWLMKFVVRITYQAAVNLIQYILGRSKKIRIGKGE